jgi:hypothetical protein
MGIWGGRGQSGYGADIRWGISSSIYYYKLHHDVTLSGAKGPISPGESVIVLAQPFVV